MLHRLLILILICVLFVSCQGQYEKRDGRIYYSYRQIGGASFREVKDADLSTFKELDLNYAKDKNHAYYRWMVIEGAKPAKFKILEENYSCDDTGIYYENRKISSSKASDFHIYKYEYSHDTDSVYFKGEAIQGADPNSFEMVKSTAKDKNAVYDGGVRCEQIIDPESYVDIVDCWGKDKFNYYCNFIEIEIADYPTFEILNDCYAKDKYNVYYSTSNGASIVEGADPKTFKTGFFEGQGRDKNHVYEFGKIEE